MCPLSFHNLACILLEQRKDEANERKIIKLTPDNMGSCSSTAVEHTPAEKNS